MQIEVADAAAWLYAEMKNKKAALTQTNGHIPVGTRHAAAVARAGTLRAKGKTPEEIRVALMGMRSTMQGDFPVQEIESIVQSAAQWTPGRKVRDEKVSDRLVSFAAQHELMSDLEGVCYARHGPNRTTVKTRGMAYRDVLIQAYRATYHQVPGGSALSEAIEAIDAMARADDMPRMDVPIRQGFHNEAVYIDLGSRTDEAVEITSEGWSVIPGAKVPVFFRRGNGQGALPYPEHGGSITDLSRIIDTDEEGLYLTAGFLVGAFSTEGPKPILDLTGPAGAGKSYRTALIRNLIDPNRAPTRSFPQREEDFAVLGRNNFCAAYDNVSRVAPWQWDAVCRLATGSGIARRRLYSQDDEVVYWARIAQIVNGIEDVVGRDDVRDRSMVVELQRIPDDIRRDEATLNGVFREVRSRLFGLICDGISSALKRWGTTRVESPARLADFERFVAAAAPGMGLSQTEWIKHYKANRTAAATKAADADAFVALIRRYVEQNGTQSGTPGELYHAILEWAKDHEVSAVNTGVFPKDSRHFAPKMARRAQELETIGIYYERAEVRTNRGYAYSLSKSRQVTRSHSKSQQELPCFSEKGGVQ